MHTVAVRVGEHLNFEVSRTLDDLLKIDIRVAERRRRFRLCSLKSRAQLGFSHDLSHAFPATPGCCLEHHRITEACGGGACIFVTFQWFSRARNDWNTSGDCRAARTRL